MLTALYVRDFLLYTVISMCVCCLDMFYNQLVLFPSWIYAVYEE